jgi:hypothetical protein
MKAAVRAPTTDRRAARKLEELQRSLLGLQDELTETIAWTALLCDGLCSLLSEQTSDIDPATQSGLRFAAIWLKQRNQGHATKLKAACGLLREICKLRG